jgi:hypothetical protein
MEADKSTWGKDSRRIAIELAISEMAACKETKYPNDLSKALIKCANNILEYIDNGKIPG